MQRWTFADGQHSPLSHPTELLRSYPWCGGEPPPRTILSVSASKSKLIKAFLFAFRLFPQVAASSCNLNSNDVFVLKTPKALFIWRGAGATDQEMEASKHVAGFLGGNPSLVAEGKEPGEFHFYSA